MNFKYLLNVILTIPLLPILYYQGKKIRTNIPKLPEAKGIEGLVFKKSNTTLRLITLGDSSMAGVGVNTHKAGFVGTLAEELGLYYNINIAWKVYAKSGFTALKVKERLIPNIQEDVLNLIVIGVGGNDAFKLTSPKKWIDNVKMLIAELRVRYKNQPIVFINMPPVREIPAFSLLIKYVMGNLLDFYSDELVALTKSMDGVFYCSSKIMYKDYIKRYNLNSHSSEFFSEGDKFHASKLAYQIWAKDIANFITENKNIKNRMIDNEYGT